MDVSLSPSLPGYIFDGRLRRGEKRRSEVLARALEVASTEGLTGLTIGRLAADLGMSKGHLTVLFPSKAALQIATLDAAMARFADEVVVRGARERAPGARLGGLCRAWFGYVARRVFPGGCFLYATASEYRARQGRIRDRVREYRAAWNRLLAAAVRDGQRAGRIPKKVDVADLVVELAAYQAGANLAALLGDRAAFGRAERMTRRRLRRLADAARAPARTARGKSGVRLS